MIINKFEEQVKRFPDKIAIKDRYNSLTYCELNRLANCTAGEIIALDKRSGNPGLTNVSLLFEHGSDAIVGIIGALKASKTYVPMDPGYPQPRMLYILEHSESYIILTNNRNFQLAETLVKQLEKEIMILNMDNIAGDVSCIDIERDAIGKRHAYILYTSGSTGKPKGVVQNHENILYFIEQWSLKFSINESHRMTLLSSLCHDAAVPDIFGALLNGAALYPYHIKERADMNELSGWLQKERISVWHSVPTFYRFFTRTLEEYRQFPDLKLIVLGGEEVRTHDIQLFKSFFPFSKFANIYGQTESTVNSIWLVSPEEPLSRVIIGEPVGNTEIFLADENGDIVEDMGIGEIVIAGNHAALGYWKDIENSDRVFTYNDEFGRLYWTGDMGQLTVDGSISIIGRNDFQVKIRGYRVETAEIESTLLTHHAVKETVVMAWKDTAGENYLCAYIVSDEPIPPAVLNAFLGKELPDYLVPKYFINIEKMPLTTTGKIDRKALPEPTVTLYEPEEYEAPSNETQNKLASIWMELIEADNVGVNTSFFDLGGDSFLVITLISRIHKTFGVELQLKDIFANPTIKDLSRLISGSNRTVFYSFEAVEEKEYYDVSPDQLRMYTLNQFEDIGVTYNIYRVLKIEGEVDRYRFREAYGELIKRHESLRTSFEMKDGKLIQRIHKDPETDLIYIDTEKENLRGEDQIKRIIRNFIKPFNLNKAPLIRAGLIRISGDFHLLIVDSHHIITDGLSGQILAGEFSRLYAGEKLPELRLKYIDYAEWLNRMSGSDRFRQQEEYWLDRFKGEIPVLNLPTDYPRPAVQSFEGDIVSFTLGKEVASQLKQLGKETGATLYIVLLTIYNIFLHKCSGQEDIVVGSIISGRNHVDLENIVGYFVKTLPLRNYPLPGKTFLSFLEEVRDDTLGAFENPLYPFNQLVQALDIERDPGRNPLFDTVFVMQNAEIALTGKPSPGMGLKISPYICENKTAMFTLYFEAYELGEEIACNFQYCTKLFERETIKRFIVYFTTIVERIIKNGHREISDFEILTEEEKKRILYDFNNTNAGYPEDKTIPHLFEEQVGRTPDHIAVVGSSLGAIHSPEHDIRLTYRELSEKSTHLAHRLIREGVVPGTIVGIKVMRSIEMILGIFGILKAGGAYLPIDPGGPVDRAEYILKDSGASICLEPKQFEFLSNSDGLPLKIETPVDVLPGHIAYIIYTSGTTGRPKGVMIEHGPLVNRLNWMQKMYPIDKNDTIMQKTPFTFDVSVWEIFWWSITGAKVYLPVPGGEKDPGIIIDAVERNKVTTMHFVPSMLSAFLEYIAGSHRVKRLSCLRQVIASGEALTSSHVEQFKISLHGTNGTNLANLYGPTEATIDVSYYDCFENDEPGTVPIGKPIDNIHLYILDQRDHLQPVGIVGELSIGGIGLARGYLNRPELTAEKFVTDRVGFHRIYRTGDLARWLPDGNIEFLGRIDSQVKIRGFRIELGEIESRLLTFREIKEAVVVAKEFNSEKSLCAYLVADKKLQIPELKTFLSETLPDYMIPSHFVRLEKIPLTANGKLDRSALPGPQFEPSKEYSAPRNEIEKKIAEIWQGVLGTGNIGIHDNFFSLGGDSIKLIQVAARIKNAGYWVETKTLMKNPTISSLSARLKELKGTIDQSPVLGRVPLTPVQKQFFENRFIDRHHFNQSVMFFSREGFEEEAIVEIFKSLQEHHDALRMTFTEKNGEILQINHDLDYPLSVQVYDLKGREDCAGFFESRINDIQSSIDLEKGPCMKVGLFRLADGDRLLIVIHHLVVDGLSWRILFEDMQTLYTRYKKGEKPVLPSKTDSFKRWSEQLSIYANSPSLLKEKNYWQEIEAPDVPRIPTDFETDNNSIKDAKRISFNMGEEETGLLLTKVNDAFGTEINDILLTALGAGIKKTFGLERLLLALEGHGREDIFEGIDINRTVGWFTGIFPVVLDFSYLHDTGRQVKEIKETLRRIPNKGVGYGILKYLTADDNKIEKEFKLRPQIIFNYLGQFDKDVSRLTFCEMARESSGNMRSPGNEREYEIEVSGIITDGRLNIMISYNGKRFKRETVEVLIKNYENELRHLIAYCASLETREYTPCDFTYKRLTIEKLDRILKEYTGIEDIYTLTPMQEGMLFHSLVDDSSYSYFEQFSFRLEGELDILLVEKSLNELFRRHDILRTLFVYKGIDPSLQVVLKERVSDFHYEDIRRTAVEDAKEDFISDFKEKDKQRSFELSKDVLMRLSVLRTGNNEYEFIWSFHHILMDGWCIGIIKAEFLEIYYSFLENREYRLPEVKPYRNYIQWLELRDKEESARYWKLYLEFYEEQAVIPKTGGITLADSGYKNERVSFVLTREQTMELNQLARENHATLNTVLQTVWGIVLGKYNAKEDVVFGAVVSGRPYEIDGVETMIGLFINTIPIRIRFGDGTEFKRVVQGLQEESLTGESYHYYPLAKIQAGSPLKQNLFDHLFVFENFPLAEQIEGLTTGMGSHTESSIKITNASIFEQTNYDFNIILSASDKISIAFQYNANIYETQFVQKIAGHFNAVLEQVIENEDIPFREIELVSAKEKNQMLHEFNGIAVEYPGEKTIHRLFEEQVEKSPDNTAVIGSSHQHVQLTYAKLNEESDRVCRLLIEKGIQPDMIVGILLEPSIDTIIGILGILKAGGAYLPIDPEYPRERIKYMLFDSSTRILLSTNALAKGLDMEIVDLTRRFELPPPGRINRPAVTPSHIAYIIYTSGTTGRAKGVLIEHHNVVRLMVNDGFQFDFNPGDVWTVFHSFCFDFSVWEVYGALLYGGRLVVIPRLTAKDPHRYLKILKQEQVTVLNQTPTIFYHIIAEELKHEPSELALRYVIFGGEALNPGRLSQWKTKYPAVRLINMYGITETTVHVTFKEITETEISIGRSNIGKPIPTLNLYVMDKNLKLVPMGVAGEACIGGEGVARGYLNRPELAMQKFVPNPYVPTERLYRSGDLVRMISESGDLEYLGRIDHQVKIRGFRIELEEIENRLLEHDEITKTVVIAHESKDREKRLAAYFVSNKKMDGSGLRDFLGKTLPGYMLPSYFVQVNSIPLTGNGKVNRKALPEPSESINAGVQYVAPKSGLEKTIADIWKEVLNVDKVGINDNIFELGGTSIDLIRLNNRFNETSGREVPLVVMFRYPTIGSFTSYLNNTENGIRERAEVLDKGKIGRRERLQKRKGMKNE